MWGSLEFVYVPTPDVDTTTRHYVELLAGHLEGATPVLVYRVDDYAATLAGLRAAAVADLVELEIPHGPCAAFRAHGGQRFAVYELTRPEAYTHFTGRFDP